MNKIYDSEGKIVDPDIYKNIKSPSKEKLSEILNMWDSKDYINDIYSYLNKNDVNKKLKTKSYNSEFQTPLEIVCYNFDYRKTSFEILKILFNNGASQLNNNLVFKVEYVSDKIYDFLNILIDNNIDVNSKIVEEIHFFMICYHILIQVKFLN